MKTRIEELDRVLGGGIVSGSLVLVGGDPGIGKSTLLLQVCRRLAEDAKKVLYISAQILRQTLQIIRQKKAPRFHPKQGAVSISLLCILYSNFSLILLQNQILNPVSCI